MLTKETLQNDLKEAMLASDGVRKNALRMLLTSVKLAEVEKRAALDAAGLVAVLNKEVKTLQESIEGAQTAGRQEMLADAEAKLAVLERYLPTPISEAALEQIVRQAIKEADASLPQHMGQVMKIALPKIAGQADGKTVSEMVRKLLAAG